MAVTTLRVLNRARETLAILLNVSDPQFTREPRAATEITVTVPRADPNVQHLQLGNYVEVLQDDVKIATGRIDLRDATPTEVTITAFTEEILLKDYKCPSDYGPVFATMDAADVVRECLERWETRRVKSKANWQTAVSSVNVAAEDVAGGSLWLARDGNGAYHRNGHAVFQFNSSSFPGFTRWDRIRWASDYPPDSLVFTTVQYRFGTSGPWLPDVSWPSYETDDPEELTQTLTGERGVLPDQVGLALSGTNPILQVRVNLYTDDPDSQDEDEEGTMGSSPAFYALEVIARAAGPVTEGDIPATLDHTVTGITASDTPAFDIIRQALEQAESGFQVHHGEIDVAGAFGPDLSTEINLVTN